MIDEVLGILGEASREKGITVSRQPDGLPIVAFDPRRLYQVFENLISNALRVVPGDGTGRVEVICRDQGDAYCFCVRDNGPGIAQEHHPRIFERFYRIGNGKRGSGLGLTIVKEIVEQQGGKVWVESQQGKGATFHFPLLDNAIKFGTVTLFSVQKNELLLHFVAATERQVERGYTRVGLPYSFGRRRRRINKTISGYHYETVNNKGG
jgi:K+-sensing histidine kinase KdpD